MIMSITNKHWMDSSQIINTFKIVPKLRCFFSFIVRILWSCEVFMVILTYLITILSSSIIQAYIIFLTQNLDIHSCPHPGQTQIHCKLLAQTHSALEFLYKPLSDIRAHTAYCSTRWYSYIFPDPLFELHHTHYFAYTSSNNSWGIYQLCCSKSQGPWKLGN